MRGDGKIMGVIPARYQSARLPGKPLINIHGKPMIYWVARRVAASALASYIVATDDPRIGDVCEEHDIPWIMTSDRWVNGTERVAEVASRSNAEYYVNIQGDEPLINPRAINILIDSINNIDNSHFVQAISPIINSDFITDTSIVKVAVSSFNEAIYFSRSQIPYPQGKQNNLFYRCLGLYMYNQSFLKNYSKLGASRLEQIESIEQLRVLENRIPIHTVIVDDDSFSVDTPEDLKAMREIDIKYFLDEL